MSSRWALVRMRRGGGPRRDERRDRLVRTAAELEHEPRDAEPLTEGDDAPVAVPRIDAMPRGGEAEGARETDPIGLVEGGGGHGLLAVREPSIRGACVRSGRPVATNCGLAARARSRRGGASPARSSRACVRRR